MLPLTAMSHRQINKPFPSIDWISLTHLQEAESPCNHQFQRPPLVRLPIFLLLAWILGCSDGELQRKNVGRPNAKITSDQKVMPVVHRTRNTVRATEKKIRQGPWPDSPQFHRDDGYVGSASCKECHSDEFSSWHSSYHSSMTQIADRSTVIPEIEDIDLEYQNLQAALEWEDDELWATITDEQGNKTKNRIVLTTGSHHAQAFWYETGNSNVVQMFPFSYRIAEQRWIPVPTAFLLPPHREQSFSFAPGVWNHSCSQCHATSTKPVVSSATEMETTVADFGIACESCHGPGEKHLEAVGEQTDIAALEIINPDRLDSKRSSEVCGQCHAAISLTSKEKQDDWLHHGWRFRPGEDLTETKDILQPTQPHNDSVDESTFWSDGVIRVSGREYNGLLQSPCYTHNGSKGKIMRCTDCHEMHPSQNSEDALVSWSHHQLKPELRDNLACTQCHQAYEDEKQLVAHTHHLANSSGSKCVNCHMPHTSYGLLKASRSHAIESPSTAVTLEHGRPNGCNICHLDKSLLWTAEHLEQWYNLPVPKMSPDEQNLSYIVLSALKGNAIQRALAAWALGWPEAQEASSTDWAIPFLCFLLSDDYHAVRFIAERTTRTFPGYNNIDYDSLAPKNKRKQDSRAIFQKWIREKRNRPTTGPAFLISEQGQPMIPAIDELLKQRDNQEIFIGE